MGERFDNNLTWRLGSQFENQGDAAPFLDKGKRPLKL